MSGINIPTVILFVAVIAYVIYEWRRLHRIDKALRIFAKENGLKIDRNDRITGLFRGRDMIMYSVKQSTARKLVMSTMVSTKSWTVIEADVDNRDNIEFYVSPKLPLPAFLNPERESFKALSRLAGTGWFFHVKNNGIQFRQGGVLRDAALLSHVLELMCDIAESVEPVDMPVMQTLS